MSTPVEESMSIAIDPGSELMAYTSAINLTTPRWMPDTDSPKGDPANSPVPESPFPMTAGDSLATENTEFTMRAIPQVGSAQLSRRFEIDISNIEVTSMDVVAHGCYVLAGCSNGLILLFDMSSPSRSGTVVGHIRAKGLHTNLLLTVKVTEDSRFCFAGVHKGSMEMLALDLSRLPGWPENGGLVRKKINYEDLIVTSSYSDPKLRGFGAVVRVQADRGTVITAEENNAKYILACGRGIKNVHIWTFSPDTGDGAIWSFVYDVASNGNTIESVGFRDGGRQAMSKSAGMCVRMWNMSTEFVESGDGSQTTGGASDSADEFGGEHAAAAGGAEPSAKLPYEDIANSHDVRTFADCFGFGGTYEFALVRLDAPKWANRELFELPSRGVDDDNGNRRKRQMRQIQDVTSTQDGSHLLILLTDGGVLYFRASSEDVRCEDGAHFCNGGEMDFAQIVDSAKGNATRATLTEFSKLSFNPVEDSAWSIKRVGACGTVVLLRAARREDDDGMTTLSVCPLSEEAPGEVADTSLKAGSKWNEWDWCRHTQSMIDFAREREIERQAALLRPKENDMVKSMSGGKPPLSRRGSKKDLSGRKEDKGKVLPTPLKSDVPNEYQSPGVSAAVDSEKFSKHISPAEAAEKVVGEKRLASSANKLRKKRSQFSTPGREGVTELAMETEPSRLADSSATASKRRRSEVLRASIASPVPSMQNISQATVTIQLPIAMSEQFPRAPIPPYIRRERQAISDAVIPRQIDINFDRKRQFQSVCESWRASNLSLVQEQCAPNTFRVLSRASELSGLEILSLAATGEIPEVPVLGCIEMNSARLAVVRRIHQVVGVCMREQLSIWGQFLTEVVRFATRRFHESLSPSESDWVHKYLSMPMGSMDAIHSTFLDSLNKLLLRQRMDISSMVSSLGDYPSSFQLEVSGVTKPSVFPDIVPLLGALTAAKGLEKSAVSLARSKVSFIRAPNP